MHTILWPQTTCSIFHHWYVQPSAWPLGLETTAVWHPVQTHLGQKECSSWHHLLAQDSGPVPNNGNNGIATTDDDVVKNIVEEVHAIKLVPNSVHYNMGKLDLDVLQEGQWWDKFCINKVVAMRTKQDNGFMLDNNSILWKMVRLRYTIEPTIVMPRRLTLLIIVEFHNCKGHQGISQTMNMIRHYFS